MKSDNLLLTFAIVAVIVSIAGAGITYHSVANLKSFWTGFATSSGTVNLTIESSALINFTTDIIDFGSGRVTEGESSATLDTSAQTVTNGNWTAATGFVVENIGNVNVTLDLMAGKSAQTLLGGTTPSYQINVTENDTKTNSCGYPINNVSFDFTQWTDVNITDPGTRICDQFNYIDTSDELRIDVKLVVPSDSSTGALGDTLTLTFAAA